MPLVRMEDTNTLTLDVPEIIGARGGRAHFRCGRAQSRAHDFGANQKFENIFGHIFFEQLGISYLFVLIFGHVSIIFRAHFRAQIFEHNFECTEIVPVRPVHR